MDKTIFIQKATKEALMQIIKDNITLYVGKLQTALAQQLGYKYPENTTLSIQGDKVLHTLNRHGKNSNLVKYSGQIPVDYEHIAQYSNFVNTADEHRLSTANDGAKVILSAKQINGHYIIVSSVSTKQNELKFRSMYLENGSYKNNAEFTKAQTLPRFNTDAYSFASDETNSTQKTQTTQEESEDDGEDLGGSRNHKKLR